MVEHQKVGAVLIGGESEGELRDHHHARNDQDMDKLDFQDRPAEQHHHRCRVQPYLLLAVSDMSYANTLPIESHR